MMTDLLNLLQLSVGGTMAGGRVHPLGAVGLGSYFNGHSIDSVIASLRALNYFTSLFK